MDNLTESPTVTYTAMHCMKPRSGQVRMADACKSIVATMMLDGFASSRVVRRADNLLTTTVVSVGTPDGYVTGVYEFPGGAQ